MTKTEALKQARERFEAYQKKQNACVNLSRQKPALGGFYRTTTVQRAWEAWVAATESALAEPEPDADWQLVPTEPTENMLQAAAHASMEHLLECIKDPARAREVGSEKMCKLTHASRYRSMLAAAPSKAPQ